MIYVKNTPNNAGVSIYGDFLDFDALYSALHIITGDEEKRSCYEAARIRVLAVCYDLRHACMGGRGIEVVDAGHAHPEQKKMPLDGRNKNVYLRIEVLWPEMLFVTMALNDFIRIYASERAKSPYEPLGDKNNIWDEPLIQVRALQAAFAKCMKQSVSAPSYSRMVNLLNSNLTMTDSYISQYIDMQNINFLKLPKEKRLASLAKFAKRLAERFHNKDYNEVFEVVEEAAKRRNVPTDEIRLVGYEYPDDIDW